MRWFDKRWAAAAVAILAAGAAAADDLWLHVRVDEAERESRVRVNLPLQLVEAAIPLIEEHAGVGGRRLTLHHHELDVADLRALWDQLKASPDATFVTVEDAGENVRVRKQGAYFLVNVEERHAEGREERVEARIPLRVMDALLGGEGDDLDVAAALAALAAEGESELVTVTGGDEEVRVWVDAVAEPE